MSLEDKMDELRQLVTKMVGKDNVDRYLGEENSALDGETPNAVIKKEGVEGIMRVEEMIHRKLFAGAY